MYFPPREIRLKDGRRALLRPPLPDDATSDLRCMTAVYGETDFLLRAPEEVDPDIPRHAEKLCAAAEDPDLLLLLCILDGEVVARMQGYIKPLQKVRHRFRLGISVRQNCWGQGIATAMLSAAEDAARALSCTQMELEVMAPNHRARALYEKLGYRIVQVKPDAVLLADGRLTDEYLMMKKL